LTEKHIWKAGSFPEITKAGSPKILVTIGDAEYFVLGDNRNYSEDSRFADVGNVTAGQIVGKSGS
jgi:signal peptidase I